MCSTHTHTHITHTHTHTHQAAEGEDAAQRIDLVNQLEVLKSVHTTLEGRLTCASEVISRLEAGVCVCVCVIMRLRGDFGAGRRFVCVCDYYAAPQR